MLLYKLFCFSVSKDQLIHLKDAYVKLDKLENNSINKTLNSFGSFEINSNKHSTPMQISKEDENINGTYYSVKNNNWYRCTKN